MSIIRSMKQLEASVQTATHWMMQGEGFFNFSTADCQRVLVREQILNKARQSSPTHLDELMMIIDQN